MRWSCRPSHRENKPIHFNTCPSFPIYHHCGKSFQFIIPLSTVNPGVLLPLSISHRATYRFHYPEIEMTKAITVALIGIFLTYCGADDDHGYRGLRWGHGGGGHGLGDGVQGSPGGGGLSGGMRGFRGGSMAVGEEFDHSDIMRNIRLLVLNRNDLSRTVTNTTLGVVTHTWSDMNPHASDWVKQHVSQMFALIDNGHGIRDWDPMFSELFDYREELKRAVNYDETGVEVTLSSTKLCATRLVQAHAQLVSAFIQDGYDEVMDWHSVPEECD